MQSPNPPSVQGPALGSPADPLDPDAHAARPSRRRQATSNKIVPCRPLPCRNPIIQSLATPSCGVEGAPCALWYGVVRSCLARSADQNHRWRLGSSGKAPRVWWSKSEPVEDVAPLAWWEALRERGLVQLRKHGRCVYGRPTPVTGAGLRVDRATVGMQSGSQAGAETALVSFAQSSWQH